MIKRFSESPTQEALTLKVQRGRQTPPPTCISLVVVHVFENMT